jgi:hypothetical protein
MKNLIEFSIGDWSNDGHGKEQTFIILCNKTSEELREIYFAACDKLKIRLDGHEKKLKFPVPCEDYEDGKFSVELYNYLVENGVKMPKFKELEEGAQNGNYFPSTTEFLAVVLALIQWGDKSIVFDLLKPEVFHFYGFDKKKRHIGYFGYGLLGS